ncbi:branched-chain amino acid ABC transporter ATP-binding protein [Aestuariivirga litoralis]|uniref:branched-chain amino acid ABC transporter ATP-binding protein n=1 Tax=Aestuariivirga litoralis TaxID=2650924 RepID=UPI0018C74147|nr:ABC transporter ATP-binding protein [Aestuariivirga litoralis]MBG1232324.1 ABC transporter ATP-binding protein [Aestuariivirga litoralis]
MSAILSTAGLVAGYERDLPIVRGINLEIKQGELVTILGPNGAGKSTFVKAIAGTVPVFGGKIMLDGKDITSTPLHNRIREGLAFVPQTENIFASLTIAENLQLAADILPKGLRAARIKKLNDTFPDLASRPGTRAGALSGGQRQMLAVARALMVEPHVLILDEPSAGLSPKIVGSVFQMLRDINKSGVTIVLVEQNVKAALAIADRGVILVEGVLRHQGTASELGNDTELGALYLGSHASKGKRA